MVKSAEVWGGDHFARTIFDRSRGWRVAIQTEMRSRFVVVIGVAAKDLDEVTFTERDDVIRALPANRT